jgi:protein-arginine kinase activator protein McsA
LSQPTGDGDVDAARATFVEKLQELKVVLESGDSERASELRDELKDLRSELGSIKSYRK